MTTNTLNKPIDPELESQETNEEVELQWPQPERSVDEALLNVYKTWVLRLLLSPLITPNQILNAMRRLEVMKEFPLRQEKQSRTLALAEARVELRRRTLDLKEAQLKDKREMREIAAAKAAEKAARQTSQAQTPKTKATPSPAPAATQRDAGLSLHTADLSSIEKGQSLVTSNTQKCAASASSCSTNPQSKLYRDSE